MKQWKLSSGVHTIGSPRTLKLVLTITGRRQFLEPADEGVNRAGWSQVNGLDAGPSIDVMYGGWCERRDVQLVDANSGIVPRSSRCVFLLHVDDRSSM